MEAPENFMGIKWGNHLASHTAENWWAICQFFGWVDGLDVIYGGFRLTTVIVYKNGYDYYTVVCTTVLQYITGYSPNFQSWCSKHLPIWLQPVSPASSGISNSLSFSLLYIWLQVEHFSFLSICFCLKSEIITFYWASHCWDSNDTRYNNQ